MKKYEIIWAPQAYTDLQNIQHYLKHYLKEKHIANKLNEKIITSTLNLSYFPERYVKIQSRKDKSANIRKMVVENYVIIYEVDINNRTSFYSTYFS